jgi:hypothetical protein
VLSVPACQHKIETWCDTSQPAPATYDFEVGEPRLPITVKLSAHLVNIEVLAEIVSVYS